MIKSPRLVTENPRKGDESVSLPGDELVPDASVQITHEILLGATPDRIWPWLVQMGCGRAGWYSHDLLDNGGKPSAREIHPEWQDLKVGDVLPATPKSNDGFEVLVLDEPHALVLGGLDDRRKGTQRPFTAPRPEDYWHYTWVFVLLPAEEGRTRLLARSRLASSSSAGVRWIQGVHNIMQEVQLRRLKARVEGTLSRDTLRDVAKGIVGAAGVAFNLLTPFLRGVRNHWGLDAAEAERNYPGDELVPEPRWDWTHAVEIEASPDEVWPWVAQVGADRGGFYSYQWLENLVGCHIQNTEVIRPEWALREGDSLLLHPEMDPLQVVAVDPGRSIVAYAGPDEDARGEGEPWMAFTWLFFLEPIGDGKSRLISRVRSSCSDDLAMQILTGPYVTESVGFVMDRRMLLGIKERAEG